MSFLNCRDFFDIQDVVFWTADIFMKVKMSFLNCRDFFDNQDVVFELSRPLETSMPTLMFCLYQSSLNNNSFPHCRRNQFIDRLFVSQTIASTVKPVYYIWVQVLRSTGLSSTIQNWLCSTTGRCRFYANFNFFYVLKKALKNDLFFNCWTKSKLLSKK